MTTESAGMPAVRALPRTSHVYTRLTVSLFAPCGAPAILFRFCLPLGGVCLQCFYIWSGDESGAESNANKCGRISLMFWLIVQRNGYFLCVRGGS